MGREHLESLSRRRLRLILLLDSTELFRALGARTTGWGYSCSGPILVEDGYLAANRLRSAAIGPSVPSSPSDVHPLNKMKKG